jgi:hypothetical protein
MSTLQHRRRSRRTSQLPASIRRIVRLRARIEAQIEALIALLDSSTATPISSPTVTVRTAPTGNVTRRLASEMKRPRRGWDRRSGASRAAKHGSELEASALLTRDLRLGSGLVAPACYPAKGSREFVEERGNRINLAAIGHNQNRDELNDPNSPRPR